MEAGDRAGFGAGLTNLAGVAEHEPRRIARRFPFRPPFRHDWDGSSTRHLTGNPCMRAVLAVILSLSAPAAFASATCAPVDTDARVLASADYDDVHPDWDDGSTIGLSWSLDLQGDVEGEDGEYYLHGDLIDPRGNLVTEGVFVSEMEWECDADE